LAFGAAQDSRESKINYIFSTTSILKKILDITSKCIFGHMIKIFLGFGQNMHFFHSGYPLSDLK
jgi:hypothetical protein